MLCLFRGFPYCLLVLVSIFVLKPAQLHAQDPFPISTEPVEDPTMVPTIEPTARATICPDCPELEPGTEPPRPYGVIPPNKRPDPERFADYDYDGLTNGLEDEHGTDRENPDSDGDGFNDFEEINAAQELELIPSDPNDPNSIPKDELPPGYGGCGVDHVHEDPSLNEILGITNPSSEGEVSFCSVKDPEKPSMVYSDPDLYTPYNKTGAGICATPCETKYTYYLDPSVPVLLRPAYRKWVTIGLQTWLTNARNCLTDCPSMADTTIEETHDRASANLVVEYLTAGAAVSWGEASGVGKGKIQIHQASERFIIIHEIGHACGLNHTTDLHWNQTPAGQDPYAPLSPIMSYGYLGGKPHPICLRPEDSEVVCKLVSHLGHEEARNPKWSCSKEEVCCLDNPDEVNIVGERRKGTRRQCWKSFAPPKGQKDPIVERAKYTRCQADDDICMACKNTSGALAPWSLEAVMIADSEHPYFGMCFVGLYCFGIEKFYPGIGDYILPRYKDKDGKPLCNPPPVATR